MSWVLAISGIVVLIVLHEAGHMLAAKATGMRVERFFLFFPPKLVSIKRGETEYGIGAIPLGGFVRITGMNPEEELPEGVAHRAYYAQPVWKRIVVIAAGPAVNIVIAVAIFFLIATGFGLDGPVVNRVGVVQQSSPAAGKLGEGDRLLAIDGEDVSDLTGAELAITVAERVQEHTCEGEPAAGCEAATAVRLEVLRDGERRELEIRPTYVVPSPAERREGLEPRMLLGFRYDAPRIREDVAGGIDFALHRMWFIPSRTAQVFARIHDAEERRELTGVIGATEITRQSFEFDTRQAIMIIGMVSLMLGLLNLLPILPLDGGHIFMSVVEKLRGRRPSLRTMERTAVVGIALVAVLFFITLNNDLSRIFGEGFDVR